MSSRYYDTTSILNVIGCVYNNPSLLDFTDKYHITEEDFSNDFHKTVFGVIYRIYELGAKQVRLENIADFLSSRPKSLGIYKENDGDQWLIKVSENANPLSFDYYYNRMKKMTLLRMYDNFGIDVTDIYDPDNILDVKKKQLQEDKLDNSTLGEIADVVDAKIDSIRMQYVDDMDAEAGQAAEGIRDLVESFKTRPELGAPLYGSLWNTVHRGARLKKFYLRSAPSGLAKTRVLAADACYLACREMYDETFGWIKAGSGQSTLFICTEQDRSEIQTLFLSFLSNVNEEHILTAHYEGDEEERVTHAIEVLEKAPLYVQELPDFSLSDLENVIKKNIREHDVKYVFFDYIFSSMKIMEEITNRSAGVKIREDNILFMLSTRLKDLCNIYGIFLESATQLSGDFRNEKTPDQTLLRGAKSLADKIDMGAIQLRPTDEDLEKLEPVLNANVFGKPDMKISVYKNRRGRYNAIYLWCKADLGTCRVNPMFATTWQYELIQMNNLEIKVQEDAPWEKEN